MSPALCSKAIILHLDESQNICQHFSMLFMEIDQYKQYLQADANRLWIGDLSPSAGSTIMNVTVDRVCPTIRTKTQMTVAKLIVLLML